MRYDVIIIGGGPAGIMTAITAGARGKEVLLIERNSLLGKKLLLSGNGRCNVTNSCDITEFLTHFSNTRDFLRNAFAKFFNRDLMSFFEELKVKLKIDIDSNGRVFPKSDKADDILKALIARLKKENVTLIFNERVKTILTRDNGVIGIKTYSNQVFHAAKVVIATGGCSYPSTGSTGDGYKIADKLGHNIIELKPALAAVKIKEKIIREWQGISLTKVGLTLFVGRKKIEYCCGDMVFTHFGLSGPVVLDISARVYSALKTKKDVTLSINFEPTVLENELKAKIIEAIRISPRKSIKNLLRNFLPKKMVAGFLKCCLVDGDKPVSQVTVAQRTVIINSLRDLRLNVSAVLPIEKGIVTAGGVNTIEINPKTMASKIVAGLYFAGEVIDIDAGTGGYNMQAAFSTGWACGSSV